MDEVDYLVLGGGSAGCVLASRLSEDPGATVALIEAGGSGDGWVVETPIAGVLMAPTKLNNWAYETVPQPGLGGRRGYQPRGRALGGSSAINAMIYTRGHPADYDAGRRSAIPAGPTPRSCPTSSRRRTTRPSPTRSTAAADRSTSPIRAPTIRSSNASSPPRARRNSRSTTISTARARKGSASISSPRSTASAAAPRAPISRPHLGKRPNLRVETHARALRLLFDGKRAIGAEILQRGVKRTLRARRETIVSSRRLRLAATADAVGRRRGGGAGRARRSRRSIDLPGVGANLHDHPDVVLGYASPLARPARPVVRRARAARRRRSRAIAASGAAWRRPISPRPAASSRRGPSSPSPTSSSISSSRWSRTTRASCAGAAA